MSTNSDNRPDAAGLDWSSAEIGRYALKPGERSEVRVDGAIGYSLRLIPSNKVLARFTSTLEAWPEIIAQVEAGRSPRTLALDWHDVAGRTGLVGAGVVLVGSARISNGEPQPSRGRPSKRVAEAEPATTADRDDESPRIISTWRATKRERDGYERRR